MERTPDEIKKGLECCGYPASEGHCRECPYAPVYGYCVDQKSKDALALIQQLEEERDELRKSLDELKEVARGNCSWCKHNDFGQESDNAKRVCISHGKTILMTTGNLKICQ